MVRRTSNYNVDIFNIQKAMATQIVEKEGNEDYGRYAGALYDTASEMAFIDFLQRQNVIPKVFIKLLELNLAYLSQQRIAEFCTVGTTEVSKLGFILGRTYVRRTGSKNLPWR